MILSQTGSGSISGAYVLASRVKSRLTREAVQNDVNLHRLVCQANMLDSLIEEINTKNKLAGRLGRTVSFESIAVMPEKPDKARARDEECYEDDYDDYCDAFSDDDSDDDSESDSDEISHKNEHGAREKAQSARFYAGRQGKSQLHRYRTDRRVTRRPEVGARSRAGRFERQHNMNSSDGDRRSYGRVSYTPHRISGGEADGKVSAVDRKGRWSGPGGNKSRDGCKYEQEELDEADSPLHGSATHQDTNRESYTYYSDSDGDSESSDASDSDCDEDEELENYSDGDYDLEYDDGSETDASDSTTELVRVESHSEASFSDSSVGYEVHSKEVDSSDEEDDAISIVSSSATLTNMKIPVLPAGDRCMGLSYRGNNLIGQAATQRLASAAC